MRDFFAAATILIAGATAAFAQSSSPHGVKTLAPEGAIKTTGTWDLGTRAGDFVFIAGMRGIDRSEEHTSELQSRLHLVCRLLLEKKNGARRPQRPARDPGRRTPRTGPRLHR